MLKNCYDHCKNNKTITVIASITLLHWIILIFKLPVFSKLPSWWWPYTSKPSGTIWQILFLIGVIIAVIAITASPHKKINKILLLIILGINLQFTFAFLEGRGIEAIRDRVVRSGHAEFVTVAARQQKGIFYLLRNYEELSASKELGKYAPSKPPGTLMAYVVTKRIAVQEHDENGKRSQTEIVNDLRDVITWTWPIISYLVLIPLYYLTKIIYSEETALLAGSLYIVIPSVNLINLHTDQVFFPFLAVMPILLSAIAMKKRSVPLAVLAGVHLYISAWFSFALALVAPLILPGYYLIEKTNPKRNNIFIKNLLALIAGFSITDILFRFLFNYDILLRYQGAITHHIIWKNWTGSLQEITYFGFLNTLEYVVWIGFPISILFALNISAAAINIYKTRSITIHTAWSLATVGIFAYLVIAGKTKNEPPRLWLFLVPYVCILGANYLTTHFKKNKQIAISAILLLQFLTIYITKINQDFW